MIKCEDVIKTNCISKYYDFVFVMYLAAECGRRNEVLDTSNMIIKDTGALSAEDIAYMHFLRGQGCLYDGSDSTDSVSLDAIPSLYIDTTLFSELEGFLFENTPDAYVWSTNFIRSIWDSTFDWEDTRKYESAFMGKSNGMGKFVTYIAAYMLLNFYLGVYPEKPVHFKFRSLEGATTTRYLLLYGAINNMDVLRGKFFVDFDKDYMNNIGDLDFALLFDEVYHAGRWKQWSWKEKIDIFKKVGFKKGSIAILYTRGKISENNSLGKITAASIVRVDDVRYGENGAVWYFTKFSVNNTIEEKIASYLSLPEDCRELYNDMVEPKMTSMPFTADNLNLGIANYFYKEDFILYPIERGNTVTKRITVNGTTRDMELSEIDAIYWTLCQYGVDFDRDLYKEFYNDGKPLLWDTADGTPPTFNPRRSRRTVKSD